MAQPTTSAEEAARFLSKESLDLISRALEGNFAPAMSVAAGLMLMAFLAHMILELSKINRGEKPGYASAIMVLALHVILLTQYTSFATGIMSIGAALTKGGNINSEAAITSASRTLTARFSKHVIDAETRQNEGRLSEALSGTNEAGVVSKIGEAVSNARRTAVAKVKAALEDAGFDGGGNAVQLVDDVSRSPLLPSSASLLLSSPTEIINNAMEALAELVMTLAFLMTSATVLLLSLIQKTAITLVMAVGPVIITLSAFPGPTSGLLFSWALTLLELQLWGFATQVLGTMMGARFAAIPTAILSSDAAASTTLANYGENIAYCFILATAYLVIPVLCGALLRGGGMGSVAGQMMGQATGFASGVVSGRLAGAMPGGGGGKGGSSGGGDSGGGGGSGDSGGGGGGGGRAGDDGVSERQSMSKGEAIAKSRAIKKNMERAE